VLDTLPDAPDEIGIRKMIVEMRIHQAEGIHGRRMTASRNHGRRRRMASRNPHVQHQYQPVVI